MSLDIADHDAVVTFCRDQQIGLVVVGPEAPLVDGLGDSLRRASIPVFGPDQAAARLEGSKSFTKSLCREAGIATADYEHFTDEAAALAGLEHFSAPYVIKADGLAAGKGVIIAQSKAEAMAAIADMFRGDFGAAGASVVIESFMAGEEASVFALSDGSHIVSFGSAQDHKRVGEGDTGLNTGGMGAYSPANIVTPALEAQIMAEIIAPTVAALKARGTPYCGVLFAGLMLTDEGPKLIEYNCRFGDPECQVLMMRFEGDLVTLLSAVATGTLDTHPEPRFSDRCALTVVMAAQGYPGVPRKGGKIILGDVEPAMVFQAGTADCDGQLVAAGGRVLNVTAQASSVKDARDIAYAAVDKISFPDGFCRRDIGWRELARAGAC